MEPVSTVHVTSSTAVTSKVYSTEMEATVTELGIPTSDLILESTTLLIILLIAIIANFSVIIVILRNESLRRNGHNILILNLAVADLGSSFGSMLFTYIAIFNEGRILRHSDFVCSLNVSLSIVCYFGSFGAIISIAVHRYLLVVQSNRFNVTINWSYVMISLSWSLAVLLTIPSATGWIAEIEFVPQLHHCGQNWSKDCGLSLVAITFTYVLVIPLMIFCYTSIALEIRESQRKIAAFQMRVKSSMKKLAGRDTNLGIEEDTEMSSSQIFRTDEIEEETTRVSRSSQEKHYGMYIKDWADYEREYQEICYTLRRAGSILDPPSYTTKKFHFKSKSTVRKRDMKLRSVLGADKLVAIAGALVVMSTIVCWTPYSIVGLVICWNKAVSSMKKLRIFCRWLSYSNSAINPIIYSMFNRSLHTALVRGYRRFFERLRRCCQACD